MTPTANRILVKLIPVEQTTSGGIFIPTPTDNPLVYAHVLAAGPKVTDVLVGDTVVFTRYAGTLVDDENIILKEEDVLALAKKSDTLSESRMTQEE